MRDPLMIVRNAFARRELDKMLLGAPEYCYRSHMSPAPGGTDLTEVLSAIYDQWTSADREQLRADLIKALGSIVETYEGLEPVASCILVESLRKARNRPLLGLPLNDLADRLQKNIERFRSRLEQDKSGEGAEWTDGCLGAFRRLSRNTEQLGGPSFCR